MMVVPLKTFIIYARADEHFKAALRRHLTPLEQLGLLNVWDDSHLLPGEEWEKSIKQKLDESDLVIMLVSEASLYSDFIQKKELKNTLERKQRGITQLVPILVRDCLWDILPDFQSLQMLPLDERRYLYAVEAWTSQSSAWASALRDIHRLIPDIQSKIAAEQASHAMELAAEESARQAALVEMRRQAEAEESEKIRSQLDETAWEETTRHLEEVHDLDEQLEIYKTYLKHHKNHRQEAVKAIHALQIKVNLAEKRRLAQLEQERQRQIESADHVAFAAAHTRYDLEKYLEVYTLHSVEARQKILDLDRAEEQRKRHQFEQADHAAFAAAQTREALEKYLETHTIHVAEARERIEKLKQEEELNQKRQREAADHAAFASAVTIADFEAYLKKKYVLHAKESRLKIQVLKEEEQKNLVEKTRREQEEFRAKYMPQMVFVKGGTFLMGDVFDDWSSDEKPVHEVTLKDFYLGKYAVTFEEYDLFYKETGRKKPDSNRWGRERRPVINVSWHDATAYCQWLSEKTGFKFRLPSEAEWEYAARATNTLFGGLQIGAKVRFGNGKNTASSSSINFEANNADHHRYSYYGVKRGQTVPVGSLNSPNALGLHDMSGNVQEWCEDWYHKSYKNTPTDGSADVRERLGKYKWRVTRGGSWDDPDWAVRAAHRDSHSPDYGDDEVGFRLAMTP